MKKKQDKRAEKHRKGLFAGVSAFAAAAAAAVSAAPAMAQDTAAGEGDEIVVTGSRIPQPNLESVSPIQVVGEQEFRLQGTTDVVDLLNTLPQIYQNAQSGFSNTSNPLSTPGGITTADLRGLGQQRTLVLVNGRRLGIGDPNTGNPNPSPDLNQIPTTLIERVEVVTGGASATYGSDAIGGVVNFIMQDDFEGFEIDTQYGFNMATNDNPFQIGLLENARNTNGNAVPEEDVTDGETIATTITIGANTEDSRGNVTGYISYRHAAPVLQRDRDYSACQFQTNAARDPATMACAGSPNSNYFDPDFGGTDDVYSVVGSAFVLQPVATSNPPPLFNSNEFSYLSRGDERFMGGFFANYEFNERLRAYSEFSFMDDRTRVQIAPSGLFLSSASTIDGLYQVNCGNPLLSAQQQALLGCDAVAIATDDADPITPGRQNAVLDIGRRNIEGGGRIQDYQHQNYRLVAGFDGDLNDAWTYDVYGSYYYATLFQRNLNYLSLNRINRALDVMIDPDTGLPACRSAVSQANGGTGDDTACVPYNIWTEGGVTAAQTGYLNSLGTAQGSTSEQIVGASFVGDLADRVHTPWAESGLQVALGMEYRQNSFDFDPDEAELSGDLSGFGGASSTVHDRFDVIELFTEARLALMENQSMAEELSLEAGYRYSDYSSVGGADTYKFGVNYAPILGLRFRGSFQHALRAPSVVESFNPALENLSSDLDSDRCATGDATLAQCLNTLEGSPLTEAQFTALYNGGLIDDCPAGQCGALLGGNVNLTPEEADTTSLGFTLTPELLPNFTASVDWYHIEITNLIGSLPGHVIMNQCLDFDNQFFCNLIRRNAQGQIFGTGGFVNQTLINAASSVNEGVDVQASYTMDIGEMGGLSFSFAGSYLIEASVVQAPGIESYDCAGLFGPTCQNVYPEWRHNARVSWDTPWNLLLSAQWRHIGESSLDANTSHPVLGGAFDAFSAQLEAKNYLDLSGIWDATEHFAVRAGMNNVTDEDPQLINNRVSGTGTPNAYPTYDLLGRVVFIGLTARF